VTDEKSHVAYTVGIARQSDKRRLRELKQVLKEVYPSFEDAQIDILARGRRVQPPPSPPHKQMSRAKMMADAYQQLEADPAFKIKSFDDKHKAVLDKLGLLPTQLKETGWSVQSLRNELSRRRSRANQES
jgi:hypothetical protein